MKASTAMRMPLMSVATASSDPMRIASYVRPVVLSASRHAWTPARFVSGPRVLNVTVSPAEIPPAASARVMPVSGMTSVFAVPSAVSGP